MLLNISMYHFIRGALPRTHDIVASLPSAPPNKCFFTAGKRLNTSRAVMLLTVWATLAGETSVGADTNG